MDVRLSVFVATILVAGLPVGPAFGQGASSDSSAYQYSQPIEPTFYDISYATLSPSQKLDLYLPPAQDRPAPVVIWIHGGAFRVGDKRSMPDGPYQIQVPDVAALTRKGYAVVSLNYRLLRRPRDALCRLRSSRGSRR